MQQCIHRHAGIGQLGCEGGAECCKVGFHRQVRGDVELCVERVALHGETAPFTDVKIDCSQVLQVVMKLSAVDHIITIQSYRWSRP